MNLIFVFVISTSFGEKLLNIECCGGQNTEEVKICREKIQQPGELTFLNCLCKEDTVDGEISKPYECLVAHESQINTRFDS